MSWLEFIAAMSSALGWPIVALVAVFFLRSEIKTAAQKIIDRIGEIAHVKAPGVAIDFKQEVKELDEQHRSSTVRALNTCPCFFRCLRKSAALFHADRFNVCRDVHGVNGSQSNTRPGGWHAGHLAGLVRRRGQSAGLKQQTCADLRLVNMLSTPPRRTANLALISGLADWRYD